MTELVNQNSFLDSNPKVGSLPNIQESPVVIATPKQEKETGPSAIGGLAALGATVLGATALGRRIPAVRNYFKEFSKPADERVHSFQTNGHWQLANGHWTSRRNN
jgi:hypothetical protein